MNQFVGELHKKTIVQFYYLMCLCSLINDIEHFKILEIGVGFGNLARIFLCNGKCLRYDIIDLAEVNRIQEYYLKNSEIDCIAKCNLYSVENQFELVKNIKYNLVLSTFAPPYETIKTYYHEVITKARFVYIVGQNDFKAEDRYKFIVDLFSKDFDILPFEYPFYDRLAFEFFATNKNL